MAGKIVPQPAHCVAMGKHGYDFPHHDKIIKLLTFLV